MSPDFTGVHHLKFPVSDLDASVAWYGRAFGAERVERFDHRDENDRLYAVMLMLPGVPSPLELRLAPAAAAATREYDPVTFGVADEAALDEWIAHLDAAGVAHSGKVSGYIGSVISVPTPDGLEVRLYTDPEGGFENVQLDSRHADIHNPALSKPAMS